MNFVYGFLMFWGAGFAGIPLALYLTGEATIFDEPFLLIFVAIGAVVFCIALRGILKNLKLKRIKKIGTKSMGMYIDSACGVTMNGTPLYYIKFSFINEEGKSIEVKTPSIYTIRQVEFYEKVKRFEIKYINNVGVITQGVDYRLLENIKKYDTDENINVAGLPNNNSVKQGYYFCDYCGNEQEKPGKCKSCGAKITSKNFRQSN